MTGAAKNKKGTVRSAFVLAWRIITYSRSRMIASLSGLGFAILLMFVQMGFKNSLLDSVLLPVQAINADVFVINELRHTFATPSDLPREHLEPARSVEGVLSVHPLYIGAPFFRNQHTGTQRPIRLLGFEVSAPMWSSPEVMDQVHRLREPGTVLIDRKSRPWYGRLTPGPGQMNASHVDIIGTFEIGTDFEGEGTVIASDETLFRIAPDKRRDRVDMGIIHTAPGSDTDSIVTELQARLPKGLKVYSRAGYLAALRTHWEMMTPIGLVFGLGLMVGFVVGVVICYQILHTDVTDHMKEFATLKAMGYADRYLFTVVMAEALLLSMIAAVPSVTLGIGAYLLLEHLTGLLLLVTVPRVASIVITTVFMCAFAGLFAVRRITKAEPADLF